MSRNAENVDYKKIWNKKGSQCLRYVSKAYCSFIVYKIIEPQNYSPDTFKFL